MRILAFLRLWWWEAQAWKQHVAGKLSRDTVEHTKRRELFNDAMTMQKKARADLVEVVRIDRAGPGYQPVATDRGAPAQPPRRL